MTDPRNKRSSKSQVLLPNYMLGKTLGIGSFGKVKLGQHILTGCDVAVKILDLQKLNDAEVERVRREIKIMGGLSHPNIIRLYEIIELKSKIYVVMEYMNRGELYDYIMEKGHLKEDEARHMFQQIIFGLEFCHLNKIAHRDLKPENLLLDSRDNVKLADFGLSNVMVDGHFLKTSCGSPNYAAPEVISGKLYAGPEVDIWSCGIILYVLLCGKFPFDADNIPSLFKQIKNGIYTLPTHLSPLARDLIIRILVIDPLIRLTIPQIREHPWFQYCLPWHLAVPAEETRRGTKKIDEEILQVVITKGFDHCHVVESLRNRIQNEATVTYYLLLDKKLGASTNNYNHRQKDGLECDISYLDQLSVAATIVRNSLKQQQFCINNGTASPKLQSPVLRNWTVGLKSPGHPREIVVEILGVLQRLNICWKEIRDYNIKCKWLPNLWSSKQTEEILDLNHDIYEASASGNVGIVDPRSQNLIKFEIQIYKAQKLYLIDLQRISGPPMLFLELCHSFISELQPQ